MRNKYAHSAYPADEKMQVKQARNRKHKDKFVTKYKEPAGIDICRFFAVITFLFILDNLLRLPLWGGSFIIIEERFLQLHSVKTSVYKGLQRLAAFYYPNWRYDLSMALYVQAWLKGIGY